MAGSHLTILCHFLNLHEATRVAATNLMPFSPWLESYEPPGTSFFRFLKIEDHFYLAWSSVREGRYPGPWAYFFFINYTVTVFQNIKRWLPSVCNAKLAFAEEEWARLRIRMKSSWVHHQGALLEIAPLYPRGERCHLHNMQDFSALLFQVYLLSQVRQPLNVCDNTQGSCPLYQRAAVASFKNHGLRW